MLLGSPWHDVVSQISLCTPLPMLCRQLSVHPAARSMGYAHTHILVVLTRSRVVSQIVRRAGGQPCAPGYRGHMCGSCIESHGSFLGGQHCHSPPLSPLFSQITFFVFSALKGSSHQALDYDKAHHCNCSVHAVVLAETLVQNDAGRRKPRHTKPRIALGFLYKTSYMIIL